MPGLESLEPRLLLSAEIHGAVWNDLNANGSWDAGESGLAGVTVYLDADNDGTLDAGETSTVTDVNGDYEFLSLSKGDYFVAEVLQPGWRQTFPTPAPASHAVTLRPNTVLTGIDFGNQELSQIHGSKWNDLNGDGVWDGGEPGLEGWTIYLDENSNGQWDSSEPYDVTDGDGAYGFTDLVAGTYDVGEIPQEGWVQTYPGTGGLMSVEVGQSPQETDRLSGSRRVGLPEARSDAVADGTGAFSWSGWSVAQSDRIGTQTAVFVYGFAGMPIIDGDPNGAAVLMDGEEIWQSSGEPILPVRFSNILLPEGTEVSSVQVHRGEGTVIAAGVSLRALPGPLATDDDPANIDRPNQAVNVSFPVSPGIVWTSHLMSGYSLGALTIFPVVYDFAGKVLTYYDRISVTVEAGPLSVAGALTVRSTEADAERVSDFVDNGSAILGYDDAANPAPAPTGGTLPSGGPCDYVIVTSSALESSFQPLIDRKVARGLTAAIVTTEYIYSQFTGTEGGDNADKVRDFIREAYTSWNTQWVLLGGDTDVVPHRGAYGYVFTASGPVSDNNIPTDLYFACLDGPWNDDGDGVWGESNDGSGGGDVDLVADLAVGRAPVSDSAEAANFVAKTILYETASHPHPTQAVFLGEQLDSGTWGGYHKEIIAADELPSDWTVTERYEKDASWSGADLIADLNASPHIVNHDGHANQYTNAKLSRSDVDALTNTHPYFMYSIGCLSGAFDAGDSIAEHHLKDDHAAVGVVMNSRYGWYWMDDNSDGPSFRYDREFWDAVFDEDLPRFGEALNDSKLDNLGSVASTGSFRWLHYCITLLGDPETSFHFDGGIPGTHSMVLDPGEIAANIDFGNVEFPGEIHGSKWHDLNASGIRDAGEPGLEGWTIFLDQDNDGILDAGEQSAVTDANGDYSFIDLPVGDYTVAEVLQSGWRQLFPTGDGRHTVALVADQILTGIEFGNQQLAQIQGSKWHDLNASGIREAGEPGLEGWTIYVDLDEDGRIDADEPSATTDANGEYIISDVFPGTHSVREVLQADWQQTFPSGDGTHTVTIGPDQIVSDINFGNVEFPGEIYGRIWDDINRDGVMDEQEAMLSGWTVFLDLDEDGLLDAGEPARTTDATGEYAFVGLAPRTYRVALELPTGWRQTCPVSPSEYYFTVHDQQLPAVGLDFEELAHSEESITIPPYERDKIHIDTSANQEYDFTVFGPTSGWWAGSFALQPSWANSQVIIERVDGGLFTLSSIDLANGFLSTTTWITLSLTGVKKGGETVTETLGGWPGYFQTFPLTQMVDVKSVSSSPIKTLETFLQIDNLVIDLLKDVFVNVDFGAFLLPEPFVVTTLTDELDGDYSPDDISLREALVLASQQQYGDIIEFDPSLSGGTILLDPALGQLEIDTDVEINGLGAEYLTIDADQNSRVFYITPSVTAVIRGLTITGGLTSGLHEDGGGILNPGGFLTIEDSVISGNQTLGGGTAGGGGIYSARDLTIRNSTISNNSSSGSGGGLSLRGNYAVASLVNCIVENNSSASGGGGILAECKQVSIVNCTIAGNTSLYAGGGISSGNLCDTLIVDSEIVGNRGSWGGGIKHEGGLLTIVRSSIVQNEASDGGGGIYCNTGQLRVLDSSICFNVAETGSGGGIYSWIETAISNTTIAGNLALEKGGGIYFGSYGNVPDQICAIRNSTIAGNVAFTTGGVYTLNSKTILHNTIAAVNFLFDLSINDVAGDFDPASSHNVIGAFDGSTGLTGNNSMYGTTTDPFDPGLMPLNYGPGMLPYYGVLPTSPVIDAGNNSESLDPDGTPLTTDQRGVPRPFDGDEDGSAVVDIGAVEYAFGVFEIHGMVFSDSDGDGSYQPQAGEGPLAGWTAYIDLDRNGQLDGQEPATVTDGDGLYQFSGLSEGSYVVSQLPPPSGWQQTVPTEALTWNVDLFVTNRRDHVFDASRNMLYVTTSDGLVQRCDLETGTMLSPFTVGTSLNGCDITPGGDYLYVTEGVPGSTEGFVHKIDLDTGTVTTLPYLLEYGEAGAWDVTIASNGKAFVTTMYDGSGRVPLREIDLSTDTFSIRQDVPDTSGELNQETHISRSSDRSLISFAGSNTSSGPVFLYDATTDSFSEQVELDVYLSDSITSVNHDGSLVAVETDTSITILDADLNVVCTLLGLNGGLSFSATDDILYAVDTATDEIVALDTGNWSELSRLAIGEDMSDTGSAAFDEGVMTVGDDGKHIFLSTSNGVRLLCPVEPGSHVVELGARQVVTGIDFGNQQEQSPAPGAPDLLPGEDGDTGRHDDDDVTMLDNGGSSKTLQFLVNGTVSGAAVKLYYANTVIGGATASGSSTVVTTDGVFDLPDGIREITATQTEPGKLESPESDGLSITVDTIAPQVTSFGLSSTYAAWALGTVDSSEWTTGRSARTAPWFMIDRFVIDFDEIVFADSDDLSLTGQTSGPIALTGSGGSGTGTLSWDSADYLLNDRYQLLLSSGTDGVEDLAGNTLDDDWSFDLNVLIGDGYSDGVVDDHDLSLVLDDWVQTGTVLSDFDGDGITDDKDLAQVLDNWGESLPPPPEGASSSMNPSLTETDLLSGVTLFGSKRGRPGSRYDLSISTATPTAARNPLKGAYPRGRSRR